MDRNNLGWSIVDTDRFLFFQLLDQSAHLRFEAVEGLTCVGNTCNVGRDDGGKGQYTPDYSIVLRALTNSVVANNVMHQGALKKLIVDLGGHGEGFVLKDNPGSLFNTHS